MTRPLLITDCDEVLLHMVVPFRAWLDEEHDVHFSFENEGFAIGCGADPFQFARALHEQSRAQVFEAGCQIVAQARP